jgi:hypothetical protein
VARVSVSTLVLSTFINFTVVTSELGVAGTHSVDTSTMRTAATAAVATRTAKASGVTVEHSARDGVRVEARSRPVQVVALHQHQAC